MQPNFTLKKWRSFLTLAPAFFVLFSLFSPKTNAQCTWSNSTVYPIPIMDGAMAAVGSNVYSFAGVTNGALTANSYKFDGGSWTPIAPLPIATEFSAAVSNGTDVYVLGGANSVGAATNNLWRYNVATNTYTTLAPFTTATWNQAAVFLNNKIYKIGGTGAAAVNAVEIYDIATN